MRTWVARIAVLSVLLISVDGASDMAREGHPHSDDAMHQVGLNDIVSLDNDEHCEHCCHGHAAGITSQSSSVTPRLSGRERHRRGTPFVLKIAQAPPTPPPIA